MSGFTQPADQEARDLAAAAALSPATGNERRPVDGPTDLLGLPQDKLAAVLEPHLDRPFRAGQIYRALYEQDVDSFESMTGLPKALRSRLAEHFVISTPEITARHESADGTVKYLFGLADGATIEAVDIPDGRRRTLCLSSQAGCALACRFCVTGYWGAGRNLTAGEIVAQVRAIRRVPRQETHGLNLVFMGMGEPLLNLPALEDALEILFQQISWRRMTLSTAGVIPGIEAMARWPRRPRLAISLHAPDDERRSELMPINRRYPLRDLVPVLRRFPLGPKERITFEYILIDGWNDAPADADLLAELLAGVRAKVNLIPLNPDPVLDPRLQTPSPGRVDAFRRRLLDRGLLATTRRQRGDDVSAACGQLRVPGRTPRGFRRSKISL
ncbi:MAG: 23S rRNA (adenine(2503)-C(2))-methyltransferase RlmN [Acidobacteriota bacterium]